MVALPDPDPTDLRPEQRVRTPVPPGPLADDTIWYEDPTRKQVHRDLVVAGMERARRQGKRIGRPRVDERPEFKQRFAVGSATHRTGRALSTTGSPRTEHRLCHPEAPTGGLRAGQCQYPISLRQNPSQWDALSETEQR